MRSFRSRFRYDARSFQGKLYQDETDPPVVKIAEAIKYNKRKSILTWKRRKREENLHTSARLSPRIFNLLLLYIRGCLNVEDAYIRKILDGVVKILSRR